MVEKSFTHRLRARAAISSFEVIRPQKNDGSRCCFALPLVVMNVGMHG